MKKNKKLVVLFLALILLCSGCTKYLSDKDNKRITNEVTGQAITSNILCLPEDKDLLKIYEENKESLAVDYDSLKPCSEYAPGNIAYAGLWETIFIKPLAWVIIKLGIFIGNYGLSVMILGIIIRLILLPFSKKSLNQSEGMKRAQSEIQAIQRKYDGMQNKDQTTQMQMSQEIMAVYKKHGVNPAGGCVTAFIQLPILLAFYEAIQRVPAIFEETLLSLQLGTSPIVGIKAGNFLYILVIILIIATTYFSYKNSMSMTGNDDQAKQMGMMMKVMLVFITIASLTLPCALGLYWIVSNGFMIVQNLIIKKSMDNKKSSGRVKKAKVIKEKKGK